MTAPLLAVYLMVSDNKVIETVWITEVGELFQCPLMSKVFTKNWNIIK